MTQMLCGNKSGFDDCGIVLDNCGLELVTDLFCRNALSSGCADTITLCAKSPSRFSLGCQRMCVDTWIGFRSDSAKLSTGSI